MWQRILIGAGTGGALGLVVVGMLFTLFMIKRERGSMIEVYVTASILSGVLALVGATICAGNRTVRLGTAGAIAGFFLPLILYFAVRDQETMG